MAVTPATTTSAKRSRSKAIGLAIALSVAGLPMAAQAAAGLPMTAQAGAVERGGYLAAAAGCDRCHTDTEHGGRPYAGGRALETAFGTIVSPNITPDRKTGIGGWSPSDFARAMRWGVAPDASHYLPSFPFAFFNRLSARDLADLEAFLDSLPAVSQVNRAGDRAPFAAARGAVASLASRFPGPFQPDPKQDAVWNRGAYLVATIGRCGDCHTPRNWLGAPDPDRFLAGAPAGLDGKKVPNITPDPKTGIGKWTVDDIVGVLTDGHTPDFDFVGGSMAEIVKNTTRLDAADRRAIAVYLKSLPPVGSASVAAPKKD